MEMLANFLHNSFEKPPESYKKVANRKGREGVVRGICVLYTFVDDDLAENKFNIGYSQRNSRVGISAIFGNIRI